MDSLMGPWLGYGDILEIMHEAIIQGFIWLKLFEGSHLEPLKTRETTGIYGVYHIRGVIEILRENEIRGWDGVRCWGVV